MRHAPSRVEPHSRWLIAGLAYGLAFAITASAQSSTDAKFFRGLNLNGPALTIQGQAWEGQDASWYECSDKAFNNQTVELKPAPEPSLAQMIRSSRWGGNRVVVRDLPAGQYTVFLYVWEDNQSETYSVSVNGRAVAMNLQSGATGHWERLGPWFTQAQQGQIEITSKGGAANFSGIEIWSGHHDGVQEAYSEEQLAFFEKRIRPVLVERCYECHSQDSDEPGGGLLLDSRMTLRQGASSGPGVIPGRPQEGTLLAAMKYHDDGAQMPPDGKLSDEIIADFERWIADGASDPRATATKHSGKRIDLVAARQFWSLRPIIRPGIPTVAQESWVQNDIDRFILAAMEREGLTPASPASKRSLLRRATYDLTGLPPTPAEADAFLADKSPQAFERVVDRLLSSPRYGERWGRHWMDIIRYADTAGDNSDFPIPQMRLYRDWIIDALNQDMAYDEFIRSQLAGDLMTSDTASQREARIIATGYIANARRFGSRVDDYPQHLTIEDTLDNVGRSLLGITLSCARCHDHKFDPITTKDYYALYGIFNSTRYPWPGIELDQKQRDFVPLNGNMTAYAVSEAKHIGPVCVQLKGDPTKLGDTIERRFIEVLGGQTLSEQNLGSGRDALVDWLFSDDNPLTARVIANRLWQYHFGKGVVATPNDFGRQGKPPTHPELLDHLASHLKDNGWSLKAMHKTILLSATYQQSVSRSAESTEKDPENQWLSSFPALRLDAESLRDTLLFVGGNLDLTRPGEHPFPPQSTWKFTQHNPFKAVYESSHRSVYLMTQRIQRHPYLAIFDGADPSTSTANRMVTTTPIQSLFLLNNSLVHRQAERTAQRSMDYSNDETQRIHWLYQTLFGRSASTEEVRSGRKYLADTMRLLAPMHAGGDAPMHAWQSYVRALFRLNEFVYLD